ncbi:MAG: exodeoxyribonuclease VII large subunit [Chloroflexota bacterium]|nr:exodeoxyribonuclease VII large subunit [Chloroflexota bacterium]
MDITLTVTELIKYIQKKFNQDSYLSSIQLVGEVSNHHASPAGHHYFSLKDEESVIKCVLFARGSGQHHLIDGDSILADGKISIYQARGDLQFYADTISPRGEGTLQQKFEKLKLELEAQGLFDESRKRSIPDIPRVIGIVTSKTGSVLQDILNVMKRRYSKIKIIVADTRVQGENAGESISESIKNLNKLNDLDLIILARGGGSLEDLWPFNEEIVARSIFASSVPIISAVGHETDFTISDLVADLRAPTPSVAAELSTPDSNQLKKLVDNRLSEILNKINSKIYNLNNQYSMSLDRLLSYRSNTSFYKLKIDTIKNSLINKLESKIIKSKLIIQDIENSLKHLNFDETLARGFFMTSKKEDNSLVKDITKIKQGDHLIISNNQGSIHTETIEVIKRRPNA